MKAMTQLRIGIDTSVLVRLATGQPHEAFLSSVEELNSLVAGGAEVFASNQVIGEAFAALQHHYGVTKEDACVELRNTLRSGLVSPLNGPAVLEALASSGGPGLFDSLIADDYSRTGLETLTLDRRMASLAGARLL